MGVRRAQTVGAEPVEHRRRRMRVHTELLAGKPQARFCTHMNARGDSPRRMAEDEQAPGTRRGHATCRDALAPTRAPRSDRLVTSTCTP